MGGALEARDIPAGEGYLTSRATGYIGKEGAVLVIRAIHVDYRLRLSPAQRAAAERAHRFHADACPVARTLRGCVRITTTLHLEDTPPVLAR